MKFSEVWFYTLLSMSSVLVLCYLITLFFECRGNRYRTIVIVTVLLLVSQASTIGELSIQHPINNAIHAGDLTKVAKLIYPYQTCTVLINSSYAVASWILAYYY